jgi:hypothetical protein
MGADQPVGSSSTPPDLAHEPGIGRGQRRADGVTSFIGTLATKLVLLQPRDPESEGVVERRDCWFETSFMPGRTFTSPADLNAQFTDWLSRANARVVRTSSPRRSSCSMPIGPRWCQLPPIPLHLGWRNKIRLGRDYYVRLDTNGYSVDPSVIGRMVDVAADLDRVRVRADGRVVAEHARVWARGTTLTDLTHVQTATWLREHFQQPRSAGAGDDLARDLNDYDRAFGLTSDGVSSDARHQEHLNPLQAPRQSSRSPIWPLTESISDHRGCRPPGPFASLDLVQHGLTGDAEGGGVLVDADPAVGDRGHDPVADGVADADAPGRTGSELFAGDEPVSQPRVDRHLADAEQPYGFSDGTTTASSPPGATVSGGR